MSIKNIFTSTNSDNNIVESQNLDAKGVFKAEYNYGSKEEQIYKKNVILSLFETHIISPFKVFFYPGSLNNSDTSHRIKKNKEQLRLIGGESITMKTPDGDNISGVYIKAKNFKAFIEKHFDIINERETENGGIERSFSLKNEFSLKKPYGKYTYLIPHGEITKFTSDSTTIDSKIQTDSGEIFEIKRPNAVQLGIAKKTFEDESGNFCFGMHNIPKILPFTPSITTSHPTALLSSGSINTISSYKSLASFYLMRGIDVMMVDFRGYGDSTGSPTPYKTKLDLETAYQYLSKKHKIENKDLILHGNCLGTGPSTDLAARRKGIHIILDRGFSESRNITKRDLEETILKKTLGILKYLIKKIIKIIYCILSWSFNYDNAKNLSKIQGNIAIIRGERDTFITEDEIRLQINALPNTRKGQIMKLIVSPTNHNELWTSDALTTLQVDNFLSQMSLSREII